MAEKLRDGSDVVPEERVQWDPIWTVEGAQERGWNVLASPIEGDSIPKGLQHASSHEERNVSKVGD